jgi:hypothetical protein
MLAGRVRLEANEGTNSVLDSPEAIFPYSVADYIAQAFHSAQPDHSSPAGVRTENCVPNGTQNPYGCDIVGALAVNPINEIPPFLPWPPCPSVIACEPVETINIASFPSEFIDPIFTVLRYAANTADHISTQLEPVFAAQSAVVPGWACSSPTATADIGSYGFAPVSNC